MTDRSYPGKILLFGEYTILSGSGALAIPTDRFSGKWADAKAGQVKDLQMELVALADYLDQLNQSGESFYKVQQFRSELNGGLYFQSNIPMGYGAGSSGALCAAIYDRFCAEQLTAKKNPDLQVLKKQLAGLEDFFHGSSSGVDPLISLLGKPLLVKSGEVSIVQLPKTEGGKGAIFLLDTGIQRKTEPLVRLFTEKCKHKEFVENGIKKLKGYNELAIQYFLEGDWGKMLEVVTRISLIQLEYFKEMIPEGFWEIWEKGCSQNYYKLKLCGAGGGGFILGFANDFEKATLSLSNQKIIPVKRF